MFEREHSIFQVEEIVPNHEIGLALFKLTELVPRSIASPACLPVEGIGRSSDDPCFVTGYLLDGSFQDIDVPVLKSDQCKAVFEGRKDLMCIGANLCRLKDPGSYMTCEADDGRFEIRSVASLGWNTGRCQQMATHIRVWDHLDWIDENSFVPIRKTSSRLRFHSYGKNNKKNYNNNNNNNNNHQSNNNSNHKGGSNSTMPGYHQVKVKAGENFWRSGIGPIFG